MFRKHLKFQFMFFQLLLFVFFLRQDASTEHLCTEFAFVVQYAIFMLPDACINALCGIKPIN